MENVGWAKNINDFYVNFDRACQDHTFATRIQVGTQVTAKGMKMGNACKVKKNIIDFYVNFDRTCQDHTFAARTSAGTPGDSQKNENGKCLLGKKT